MRQHDHRLEKSSDTTNPSHYAVSGSHKAADGAASQAGHDTCPYLLGTRLPGALLFGFPPLGIRGPEARNMYGSFHDSKLSGAANSRKQKNKEPGAAQNGPGSVQSRTIRD